MGRGTTGTTLVYRHKGCFAQLFLISALCIIHRQVCQCYAGVSLHLNGGSNRHNRLSSRKDKSNCFQAIQQNSQKRTRYNDGHDVCRRRYDTTKLGQASIVIEDGDGQDNNNNNNGLSIRGGVSNQTLSEMSGENNNFIEEKQIIGSSSTRSTAQQHSEDVQAQLLSGHSNKVAEEVEASVRTRKWPCGDALDKQLIKIALPCIANFAINPLVGAVDLFWINRMGNTLAVAGQAAANQIFSSSFWLTSFLPSITAMLVAKEYAKKSEEGVQDAVCQALVVGTFIAMLGSLFILTQPDRLLGGVLAAGAPARQFARPYLFIRGFAFLPSMFSLIGFSAFRGVMDTVTPLKISIFANLLNAILDPILIFNFNMGVTGAAFATLLSEFASAIIFTTMLYRRKMITPSKMFRLPKWAKLAPLLQGGAALQLRNFALNVTFLAVTRVTQSIDETGVSAAAHAMAIQTFQIGGIVLLALSTVAQTVVPNAMVEKVDEKTGEKSGGIFAAKDLVSRLMRWGLILGSILGSLQTLLIPYLQKSTPVIAVREAARVPALLASLYQVINGLVFIGEGVMVGCGSFLQLSLSTLVATIATIFALKEFPKDFGLTGVWMSFGIFNSLRLVGVFIHQKINGPLAWRQTSKINKSE